MTPSPGHSIAPVLVRVLEEDSSLGHTLSGEDLRAARRYAVASAHTLERGIYRPQALFAGDGLLGLLVLDGLMVRQVAVAERRCGELVSQGALLRPWDHFGEHAPMPFEVRWRVIETARIALLDQRFVAVVARWPSLVYSLVERSIERAHMLAFNVAIHCLHHVDVRLLVLMWHLADRFGKVTPEGTVVPVALTHRDLAELVGAQRPSVSLALGELAQREQLKRRKDRSWVLLGDPPRELRDVQRRRARAATVRD